MNYTDRNSTPAVILPGGDLLRATCGTDSWSDNPKWKGPIYRSHDKVATWKLVSVIDDAPTSIDEPAMARLPSGRLVLITRPDGTVRSCSDSSVSSRRRIDLKENGGTGTTTVPSAHLAVINIQLRNDKFPFSSRSV